MTPYSFPLSSRSPGRPKYDLAPAGGGSEGFPEPGAQPTATAIADWARISSPRYWREHSAAGLALP